MLFRKKKKKNRKDFFASLAFFPTVGLQRKNVCISLSFFHLLSLFA